MDVDLLLALLVLEADLVEVVAGALLGAARLDAGLGHVVRQGVGHRALGIVHAPRDDRPVRIAFEEVDDHFLADARDVDGAPVLAGPWIRHANPARRVLVVLALAIPVELDLHAAVLVGIDLLARRADDDRRLRALDDRLRGYPGRAVRRLAVERDDAALAVRLAAAHARHIGLGAQLAGRRNHQVFAVLVVAGKAVQLEQPARKQARRVAAAVPAFVLALQFLQADARIGLSVTGLDVLARIIVDLEFLLCVVQRIVVARLQIGARLFEVEIAEAVFSGLHLLGNRPCRQVIALPMAALDRRVVRNGLEPRDRVVGTDRIGQDEGVFSVLVLEVVVDTFLLHQPADEVEIRLAVLHAVFPGPVTAAQALLEIGEPVVLEHLLDDLGYGLSLEDAAVGAARQQPQPGPQGGPIA